MRYIFVDFEMHPINKRYKAEREICKNEIIEIGAVMLDDDYEEISSLKKYVKPVYNVSMFNHIAALTGIKGSALQNAESFYEMLKDFIDWCLYDGGDFMIYAWSANDLEQVLGEAKLKNICLDERDKQIIDKWVDFQDEYCKIIGAQSVVSLEKALYFAAIPFEGARHDALDDARNTAELFIATRNKNLFLEVYASVSSRPYQKPYTGLTYCIGDVVNLNLTF